MHPNRSSNALRGVEEATKAKTNDDERQEKTLYSDVRRGRTEEGYGKEVRQWCVTTGRNIKPWKTGDIGRWKG